MALTAFPPQSIIGLNSETVVGNPTGVAGQGQEISFALLGLLWIAGLPTSDPRVVGSPYLKIVNGVQVIAVSQSPGLSGSLTCDLVTVTVDSVAITCDKVVF